MQLGTTGAGTGRQQGSKRLIKSARSSFIKMITARICLAQVGCRIPSTGWITLAGLAAVWFPAAAHADSSSTQTANSFSLSAGASIWSGHFGAPTDTQISSALLAARYQIDGFRVFASLPYMRIKSDGTFFAGLGGTPLFVAPNVKTTKRVRDGFGDLTVGASYLLPGGATRGFDLDLSVRVKLPTASSSSQLSTGKTDYSAGVEVTKDVGRLTPFIATTYRVFGDNRQWQFHNSFDTTIGTSYRLGEKTSLLLNYEFAQASSRFIHDYHAVVFGLSAPIIGDRVRVNSYVSKGLSSGAAAISGGASVSLKF